MSDNFLLSEMTWSEIDEAMGERPVAILPLGSTQVEGPHLPVDTQTAIARAAAQRGAAKLKMRRIPALVLPPLPYSLAELTADFAGTVSLSPETLTALVRDVCLATAKRFRAVIIVHLSLDRRLTEAVKLAIDEAGKAGVNACQTDFSKKRWAEPLGESFTRGEHAGMFTTSVMMAVAPDRVRDAVRISLAPVDGPQAALKKGARSLAEAGAEDGYIGDPTAADAEEGEAHIEALAEAVAVMTMEYLGSKA
jgi:creatinine amidohydrolase/Fe(II)-dependent formamide hydrolase-like protein